MLVQLLSPITGTIDGVELPPCRGFFDAPERDGEPTPAVRDLIDKGHARAADPAELELATAIPDEGNYDAVLAEPVEVDEADGGAAESEGSGVPAAEPEPKPKSRRGRGAAESEG